MRGRSRVPMMGVIDRRCAGDAEGLTQLLDYTERLRHLAIHDARVADQEGSGAEAVPTDLDPKTLALVRLAALVAVGGAVASYGAHTDDALTAGATAPEIVDVLCGVMPVVGYPRVVAAAPKLAVALGFDTDEASRPHHGVHAMCMMRRGGRTLLDLEQA